MWRVGVEVGGTFTDLFAWEEGTGQYRTAKVLTTKRDRSEGVIAAVKQSGVPFGEIGHFMHGTTTATNALLERNYPDAAFITAEGFRDTLEIGRQSRKYLYDPYQSKPKPLIKRRHRFTVGGRMSAKGEVRRPLDEAALYQVAHEIASRGIRSVGIGFLNSYASAAHEQRAREIVREVMSDAYVVISAETRPVFREHSRFITTATCPPSASISASASTRRPATCARRRCRAGGTGPPDPHSVPSCPGHRPPCRVRMSARFAEFPMTFRPLALAAPLVLPIFAQAGMPRTGPRHGRFRLHVRPDRRAGQAGDCP